MCQVTFGFGFGYDAVPVGIHEDLVQTSAGTGRGVSCRPVSNSAGGKIDVAVLRIVDAANVQYQSILIFTAGPDANVNEYVVVTQEVKFHVLAMERTILRVIEVEVDSHAETHIQLVFDSAGHNIAAVGLYDIIIGFIVHCLVACQHFICGGVAQTVQFQGAHSLSVSGVGLIGGMNVGIDPVAEFILLTGGTGIVVDRTIEGNIGFVNFIKGEEIAIDSSGAAYVGIVCKYGGILIVTTVVAVILGADDQILYQHKLICSLIVISGILHGVIIVLSILVQLEQTTAVGHGRHQIGASIGIGLGAVKQIVQSIGTVTTVA